MNNNPGAYKSLPAVNKLLGTPEVKSLIASNGKELILFSIRKTLDFFRASINKGNSPPTIPQIVDKIISITGISGERSLKKVINTTGVIIHTNLGRAPFGEDMLNDSLEILKGYNNLEFNLQALTRGNRNDHASELLKFLSGAEDVLIVNNNAAAVMLVLRTFARNREVIVSRGELIEIGGSFRVPEIMAASDCKMVEVGTTNKTRIEDYKKAISSETALLFKAHKSNYIIKGFTEEVDAESLAKLGKQYKIPVLFDIGSGLLQPNNNPLFINEPSIKESLKAGINLVCFSGDKLLGGPQAGIIAGKKELIAKLKKEPMLRALRVCKLTLALLETACLYYLNKNELRTKNKTWKIFNRKAEEIRVTALLLQKVLKNNGIESEIVGSKGQCGGGTLPESKIESFAVMISNKESNKLRSDFSEKMYSALLSHPEPVLSILKKGNIYFDLLTVFDDEIPQLARVVCDVFKTIKA